MAVLTWAQQLAIMANAIATGGSMDPAATWVGIITAPFTPRANLTRADVTEAGYAGYARLLITAWSDPYIDGNGQPTVEGPDLLFFIPGPDDALTAYGWAFYSALTVGTLKGAYAFTDPISVADALHAVPVDADWHYGD